MKFDTLKLAIALLIMVAAVVGFYILSEESLLLRVVGLLVCITAAGAIALQTEKGRNIWSFFQEAQIELRKVVWPTRQETVQTTLIVIIVVIIVAVILWLLDMFLGWSIRNILAQGV